MLDAKERQREVQAEIVRRIIQDCKEISIEGYYAGEKKIVFEAKYMSENQNHFMSYKIKAPLYKFMDALQEDEKIVSLFMDNFPKVEGYVDYEYDTPISVRKEYDKFKKTLPDYEKELVHA